MIVNWLRRSLIAACILTVLRLYVSYVWLTAGWGKLSGGGFDSSGFLKGAIANPVKSPEGTVVYGWYVDFLKQIAMPNIHIINTIIPLGEFLVGLGLLLGCFTTTAMFFGLLMNFSYLFAGSTSSNPMDILIGGIILFAGFNAGKVGLDRWVIPYIRKTVFKGSQSVKSNQTIKGNRSVNLNN